MKLMKKFLALLLVLLTLAGVALALPVSAVDGYKEGDTVYFDCSAFPQFYTGEAMNAQEFLYVNFTSNTRYDSGVKETVEIGKDTQRFNPKMVTEKVSENVYKYVVTAENAGAQTLRFWRGSSTLLWNHSVELTYEAFSQGNNTVFLTNYNTEAEGAGSVGFVSHYDYKLEAQLAITPDEGELGDEFEVKLSYKDAIEADVTYEYEIFANDVSVAKSDYCKVTANGSYTAIKGVITAVDAEGKIVARAEVSDSIKVGGSVFSGATENGLYAHAVIDGGKESEAWQKAQKVGSTYYFFLPSSTSKTEVELYSTYTSAIRINDVTINPGEIKTLSYNTTDKFTVTGAASYTLRFMRSDSEAALYVNNDGSVNKGLWDYLTADKENYCSALSAVVDPDGTVENTNIKKIKGRGNTTWQADKKPFNINFSSSVTVGSMQATKKYSLLANFQDAALMRNRVLYDLGDAVSLRYSCDSRFVDFYVDGKYMGQYQMCQRIAAGSDNLIYDMDEDEYINPDGTLMEEFPMLLELPFGEDFYTSTNSGVDVVIKSPDVEGNDYKLADEVKAYAKSRFDRMYQALNNNSADLADYIDVDSFAKAYLIQELGKNWDTHSWYLCYVPDENGVYKFVASPVWDFDNSIGNANGVKSDLQSMGVSDYTSPTGWWGKYKYSSSKTKSNNFTYLCTKNDLIMEAAKKVWFKNFVPAINAFTSEGKTETEIMSKDIYFDFVEEAANMNYMLWDIETNTSWICDHSSLKTATFNYDTFQYSAATSSTKYDQYTIKGQFDYMVDWLTTRAAWISNEWKAYYTEGEEVPLTPVTPSNDPSVQPVLPENTISAFVFDSTGKTAGEKLEEYGSKAGYPATTGNGTLRASVNSDGYRALEWSAAEYGTGTEIVPLVTAGKKNPWGSDPYVQVTLSTKGYGDIGLTLMSAGSKKCPSSWQLAYSLDGENFTDVEGANFTIELDNRKQPIYYFENISLPKAVENADSVVLRLYAVSDVTVNGGSTADDPTGGELVINNIIITGNPVEEETTTVAPTESTTVPTTVTTTEPETEGTTVTNLYYMLGDADSDLVVSIKDASVIQKVVAKLDVDVYSRMSADADCDGVVSIKDASEIQKFVANLPVDTPIGEIFNDVI